MEYTPIGDVTAVPQPAADRASAYGLERILIDGNDADVVYRAAQIAFDKARAGEGTVAHRVSHLSSERALRADPAKYRPEGEPRPLEVARPDQDLSRAVVAIRRCGKGDRRHRCAGAQGRRRRNRSLQGRATAAARYYCHRRLRRWRLGMAELTYRDAVIRGIAQEMSRDPDVVFLGEDVAKAGGVFKATVGLIRAIWTIARA